MKCPNCGSFMKEEEMRCRRCGYAIQMVPDYNPLEDYLAGEISGRNVSDPVSRNTTAENTMQRRRQSTLTSSQKKSSYDERERRRKQLARKRQAQKKRRLRFLGVAVLLILVLILGGIGLYRTTYSGLVGRGQKALQNQEYEKAKSLFQRALKKNEKRPGAYEGLAKTYVAAGEKEKAETLFQEAIKKQPGNVEIYEALIRYYMREKETEKIPSLLEDARESVAEALKDYVIKKPGFSLDDVPVYDDVQELTLRAKKGQTIRYTTDGTAPTLKSQEYTEAIQLEEGETVIIAIAVDERNIPSLPQKKTYMVEFPVEDAPAVSPSTGQYSEAKQIEIKVPEGYEAYYTLDKTEPTTSSTKYTGPVEMPQGETLFKAILVNKKGKTSAVTTRNYLLEPGN